MSFCDNFKKPIGKLKVYTLTLINEEHVYPVSNPKHLLIFPKGHAQIALIFIILHFKKVSDKTSRPPITDRRPPLPVKNDSSLSHSKVGPVRFSFSETKPCASC